MPAAFGEKLRDVKKKNAKRGDERGRKTLCRKRGRGLKEKGGKLADQKGTTQRIRREDLAEKKKLSMKTGGAGKGGPIFACREGKEICRKRRERCY